MRLQVEITSREDLNIPLYALWVCSQAHCGPIITLFYRMPHRGVESLCCDGGKIKCWQINIGEQQFCTWLTARLQWPIVHAISTYRVPI